MSMFLPIQLTRHWSGQVKAPGAKFESTVAAQLCRYAAGCLVGYHNQELAFRLCQHFIVCWFISPFCG